MIPSLCGSLKPAAFLMHRLRRLTSPDLYWELRTAAREADSVFWGAKQGRTGREPLRRSGTCVKCDLNPTDNQ